MPVFEFAETESVRLWVLMFCLRQRELILPPCGSLDEFLAPSLSHRDELVPGAQSQIDEAERLHRVSDF